MDERYLYLYKKNNQTRAKLFVIFGVVLLIISLAPYIFKSFINVPDSFFIITIVSIMVTISLFFMAWLNYKNPMKYEAIVTQTELIIKYPNNDELSFRVKIQNIKSFENRYTDNFVGKKNLQSGLVLKNGYFYHICTKYGNDVNTMFSATKSINPNIKFNIDG